MKQKLLLFSLLICSCLFLSAQTAKFPFYRIKGSVLTSILDNADSLEVKLTIADGQATVKFFRFPKGSAIPIETTIQFALKGEQRSFEISENVPLRCYGTHDDFVIKPSKKYWLVPTKIFDLRSGKFYMSYRIKQSSSLTAPSYKSINPVPPGPPGLLF